MNKKRIITAAVSLSLVAVIGIGATMAYFTDKTDTAANVFTTGKKVDIVLTDTVVDNGEEHSWDYHDNGDDTGIQYTNVMPGDDISKLVAVGVDHESSDCYVAVQVTIQGEQDLTGIRESILDQARKNNWIYDVNDNIVTFYYPAALQADERVILFDHVDVPKEWTNDDYASTNFSVDVKAAAIQAANLEAPGTNAQETLDELDSLLNQR